MTDLQKEALEWFTAHEDEMMDTLNALCSIRSVSTPSAGKEGAPFGPGCRQVLDKALSIAREMGYAARDCEGYCGTASTGDDDNAIGIAAHLDVVPEGDKWIYPPYSPTRVGEYLFGRGVGDNKSAAVLGLYCMKFLSERHPLMHGVRLIMGCSEENGMEDLSYYASHYECPKFNLVCDAGFPVNYAQKGTLRGRFRVRGGLMLSSFKGGEVFNMVPPHAEARLNVYTGPLPEAEDISIEKTREGIYVRAQGVAAHAAAPDGGKSAIHTLAGYLMNLPLDDYSLRAARAIWEVSRDTTGENMGMAGEDPDTGKTTMVIGTCESKDGCFELQVDARLSIACEPKKCAQAFTEHAQGLGFEIVRLDTTEPVWISRDDEKVQILQKVYKDFTGRDDPPYTMGGGTYSRVLPRVVTYGPGLPGEGARPEGLPQGHGGAHAPDEYLHVPSFIKGCALYASALVALDEAI